MSIRILESGIKAIQAGSKREGARLIRIALKTGELTNELCAVGYLWLTEAADEREQKLEYLSEAVAANPDNEDARQRLASLMAAPLPPPVEPPTTTAPSRATAQVARAPSTDQIVGVIGGPNGPGTAFFVAADGLLATTRYVVGGLERVTLDLPAQGQQVPAQVVRCWPDMDIALLRAEIQPGELMAITPLPTVPDETVLVAYAANGQQIRGRQRPTKRVMAPHWIPTDIVKLADAGGNPLFDSRHQLVGMMTRNTSRTAAYLYGIHIQAIRRCVDSYRQEISSGERRRYCPACGTQSRATATGYFHCETCGSLSPDAHNLHRFPQGDPFAEPSAIRCGYCEAQVGFHGGRCLRCGQPSAGPFTI